MKRYKLLLPAIMLLVACSTPKPLDNSHFADIRWMQGYFIHPGQELYENWIKMHDNSIEHITFHYEKEEPVIRLKRKIYPSPKGVHMLTTRYHYDNTEVSSYFLVSTRQGEALFTSPDREKVKSIRFQLQPDSSIKVKLYRQPPQRDSTYILQKYLSVRKDQ